MSEEMDPNPNIGTEHDHHHDQQQQEPHHDHTIPVPAHQLPVEHQHQQHEHDHDHDHVEHQQHEPVDVGVDLLNVNGAMITLEGTEVDHIANMDNMDAAEPVNVNVNVNVNVDGHVDGHVNMPVAGQVQPVQQVPVEVPMNVNVPEPNPVSVPAPVEVPMHEQHQLQHQHQHQHLADHPPADHPALIPHHDVNNAVNVNAVHHQHQHAQAHHQHHVMQGVEVHQHQHQQHQVQHQHQHQQHQHQMHVHHDGAQVEVQHEQVPQHEHQVQHHEQVQQHLTHEQVQMQHHEQAQVQHQHHEQVQMQHQHQHHEQAQVQVHQHHPHEQVQVHHEHQHQLQHQHQHPHQQQPVPANAPVQPVEMSWHDFFIELQSHSNRFGTLDIEPGSNAALEEWVAEQRTLYEEDQKGHATSLTAERKLLLDALGFEWEHQQDVNVSGQVGILVGQQADKEMHDAGTVAGADAGIVAGAGAGEEATAEQGDAGQLAQQQHQQMQEEHAHDPNSAAALEAEIQDVATFNARLGQLQQFKEVHGHPNIPHEYKEDEDLGKWATEQRDLYGKGSLSQDRVDALVAMGFDLQLDGKVPFFTFDDRIQQLVEYKEVHGDIMIPRKCDPSLQGLGEWLHIQKRLIHRIERGDQTVLTEDRLKILLDDLAIDMSTFDSEERGGPASRELTEEEKESNRASKWDEKYHELKQYKAMNGHTNVPRRSKRDPSKDALGEWVHFQRRQHRNLLTCKNSTMSIGRKKTLDHIDFQWTRTVGPSTTTRNGTTYSTDIKEAVDAQIKSISSTENPESWNERFAEFQAYVQNHGNGNVPKNFRENPFLGRWVTRQRDMYNVWRPTLENPDLHIQQDGEDVNAFSKDKYDKLAAAGFVFEKPMPAIEADGVAIDEEDEEEEPVVEDTVDDVEIFIGYDDFVPSHIQALHVPPAQAAESVPVMPTLEQQVAATEPAPVTAAEEPKQEMELNESEVHAILEGKEEQEHQHHHPMEHVHEVPMPEIANQEEQVNVDMQNVELNNVQHMQEQESQMQVQVEQPIIQHQVLTTESAHPDIPVIVPRRMTTRVRVDWEERVLELIQFKLRKHHCNVPAKWKPNPDLADWVWRQRAQYRRYRQNQPSSLNATRITKLADLGFEFVALDHHGLPINEIDSKLYSSNDLNKIQPTSKKNTKRKGTPKSRFKEGKWLESLAKVVKYKEDTGNCNVPRKWKKDPTLGEWVHFQRRQFRLRQLNRRNHMTDERIRKLEAIGFEWTRGTNSQPSYIRLYEQNKELAAHTGLTANENHVAEAAAMSSSEVPADVTQIAVMDGEEQVKAAEIAAVVEEQLNNPAEGEMQQVANQQQQIDDHQTHEQQHYAHHEEHQHLLVADHEQQHHEVVDGQHHEGVVGHEELHHYNQQVEEHQHHMEEPIQDETMHEAHV